MKYNTASNKNGYMLLSLLSFAARSRQRLDTRTSEETEKVKKCRSLVGGGVLIKWNVTTWHVGKKKSVG